MSEARFRIDPLPPYRLDLTAWVIRRRPGNPIDRWEDGTYRRVLPLDGAPVEVVVRQSGTVDAPRLDVVARGPGASRAAVPRLRETVERLLGTQVDLSGFARLAEADPALGALATRLRGARPTRYPTVFEALTNAIACQQITLSFGLQILGRLVEECGLPLDDDGEARHAFPRPEDVVRVSPERLKEIGFSRQKARALLELARGLLDGTVDLSGLDALGDDEAVARLRELRGVGRWTAEYVLLRGLGRLNVFPGDDVGGQNNLRRWLGVDERLDYAGVQRLLGAWRDYGGLLYMYLLIHGLAEKGFVEVAV